MSRRCAGSILAAELMLAALGAPVAMAQDESTHPACTGAPVAPPPELAAWPSQGALTAAAKAGDLASASLVIGKAFKATLQHTPDVKYVLRPEKPGGSVSYGGLLQVTITEAGSYRLALGNASWIDVVKDGAAMLSTAHKPGPACSGIRKMVDFKLEPGVYTVQLSAGADTATGILVAKLP